MHAGCKACAPGGWWELRAPAAEPMMATKGPATEGSLCGAGQGAGNVRCGQGARRGQGCKANLAVGHGWGGAAAACRQQAPHGGGTVQSYSQAALLQ